MRWVVASLLILLVGAALIGLAHPRTVPGDAARIDELLAYEMGSERPIVLALPGGISRVSVTTGGLAKPSDHYDPKITFTYAFDATLETEDDRPVATRRYYQVSRISADPRGPLEADRFAARVADDAQWAEDPRTTEVDLRDLHLRPGRLRLATAAGDNDHMMVRVTLSDASNHELYHWTFKPNAQTLAPGQSVKFVTRLASPPAAARHLEVRFAKDGS